MTTASLLLISTCQFPADYATQEQTLRYHKKQIKKQH